jgi:hypothetical protein
MDRTYAEYVRNKSADQAIAFDRLSTACWAAFMRKRPRDSFSVVCVEFLVVIAEKYVASAPLDLVLGHVELLLAGRGVCLDLGVKLQTSGQRPRRSFWPA